ncbi:MAG: hypothetical protein LBQ81_09570 [Zoogloeaceae bacterium]|nr:hypothetical protein [Zoogloeaceae bacterium]
MSSVLCLLSSVFCLLTALCLLNPAQAQIRLQKDQERIQRYDSEIQRLSKGSPLPPAPVKDKEDKNPSNLSSIANSLFQEPLFQEPLQIANVQRLPERDPFELPPALSPRKGNNDGISSGFLTDGGLSLNRSWRLKALARGPSGGIAQIQSGREVITVYDGDKVNLDGMAYTVRVEADGLILRFVPNDPGNQQIDMRVR